jgi:hypothetical protein
MEEIIENAPTNYDAINMALGENESNHPVLHKLKEEIATEKAQAQRWKDLYSNVSDRYNEYQETLKNVLLQSIDTHDKDTVIHIAEELEVDLVVTKSYEVNVTIRVDVELEVGQSFDPEWDLEISLDNRNIVDYSSDVIWSNEV